VPDEREYVYEFEDGVRLRGRFLRDHGQILEFLIQLEAAIGDVWMPVVRYDSAHGRPHRDRLDRWGREVEKHWLPGNNNDALTGGTADIKQNWKRYVAQFMEDKRR
jgi:hypothetical protein